MSGEIAAEFNATALCRNGQPTGPKSLGLADLALMRASRILLARAGPIRGCQTGNSDVFLKFCEKLENFVEKLLTKCLPSPNFTLRAPRSARLSLSPIQHLAIRHLAAGTSVVQTAIALKLGKTHIKKWMELDEFKSELTKAAADHVAVVEAMLIVGEREAAQTLMDALKAESRGAPNWTVRLNAALSLLDRAGQRGRAVEKQQIAQVVARATPDVEAALQRALRDPGVRNWLKDSGTLALLPSGEEVTTIEADLQPDNPENEPLVLYPEKTA